MYVYSITITDKFKKNGLVYFNDGWTKNIKESYLFLTREEAKEFAREKFTHFNKWFITETDMHHQSLKGINILDNLIYNSSDEQTVNILNQLVMYREVKEEILDSGDIMRKVSL